MGAGNPTLPDVSDQTSEWEGTVHAGTGILHKPWDVDENDDPTHAEHITQWEHRVKELLAGANQGKVVDLGGRDIGAFALKYKRGGTLYSFPGETSTTLDASDDHYIYLDADETLKVDHVEFPADSFHLAYVETDGADITLLEDRRWENADVGGTNAWSAVAATQDVDMDDNWLLDLRGIDFSMPGAPLTISGGALPAPTGFYHTIFPEGAGADDLDTIGETAGQYPLLLLQRVAGSATITVKHNTGNILLPDGDFAMDADASMILLMRVPYLMGSKWFEIGRNRNALEILTSMLDCANYRLKDVGALDFADPEAKTIAAGAITITRTPITLTPQTGNTDDLDSISGAHQGQLVILQAADEAYAITVKHSTGIGELNLANDTDFVLDGTTPRLVLICTNEEEERFLELSRTPMSIEDLVDTARSIPQPIDFSIPGALAAGAQEEWHRYCKHEIVIVNATGYVDGVPGGGTCIVDILDNGVSIFANEGEMIVIADGAHQDTSATKNHVVAAGHKLSCEIKDTGGSPNGADSLTVAIDAMVAPKNEP